jgi:hypothetical protein
MAFCEEAFGERQVAGDSPSVSVAYKLGGWPDTSVARMVLLAQSPYVRFGLYRQSAEVAEMAGPGYWDGVVVYGPRPPAWSGIPEINVDTTGVKANRKVSRRTLSAVSTDGVVPNFRGLIGVSQDSVEGCEVVIPGLKMTVLQRVPFPFLNLELQGFLHDNTGKVNRTRWHIFKPGEALYEGATYRNVGVDYWEITYHISGSPDLKNIELGPNLTVADKPGHAYLWVRNRFENQANLATLPVPHAAYVEEVYYDVEFRQLGL